MTGMPDGAREVGILDRVSGLEDWSLRRLFLKRRVNSHEDRDHQRRPRPRLASGARVKTLSDKVKARPPAEYVIPTNLYN